MGVRCTLAAQPPPGNRVHISDRRGSGSAPPPCSVCCFLVLLGMSSLELGKCGTDAVNGYWVFN